MVSYENNFYLFGNSENTNCYHVQTKNDKSSQKKFIKLPNIPQSEQLQVPNLHACAHFKISNNDSDDNNNYVLIYVSDKDCGYYQIFDCKKQMWDNQTQIYEKQWCLNKNIMQSGESKYGFGQGMAMITHIFNPTIIHCLGGHKSANKYGVFTMNDFNKPGQGFVFFL